MRRVFIVGLFSLAGGVWAVQVPHYISPGEAEVLAEDLNGRLAAGMTYEEVREALDDYAGEVFDGCTYPPPLGPVNPEYVDIGWYWKPEEGHRLPSGWSRSNLGEYWMVQGKFRLKDWTLVSWEVWPYTEPNNLSTQSYEEMLAQNERITEWADTVESSRGIPCDEEEWSAYRNFIAELQRRGVHGAGGLVPPP